MPAEDDEEAMHPALVGRLGAVESELKDVRERMDRIEAGLEVNNEMTSDIHELMELGRTGFKVLHWIGRAFSAVARWVAPIAAAVAAVYAAVYAIKTGHPPPK